MRATAPVWIATGTADETVVPAWQHAYIDAARDLGSDVTHREYEGEDHVGVDGADQDLAHGRGRPVR